MLKVPDSAIIKELKVEHKKELSTLEFRIGELTSSKDEWKYKAKQYKGELKYCKNLLNNLQIKYNQLVPYIDELIKIRRANKSK
tara:strand:- start:310 stop:561 length:252 start_codon:yes stop_codon:yes gene_type:complete